MITWLINFRTISCMDSCVSSGSPQSQQLGFLNLTLNFYSVKWQHKGNLLTGSLGILVPNSSQKGPFRALIGESFPSRGPSPATSAVLSDRLEEPLCESLLPFLVKDTWRVHKAQGPSTDITFSSSLPSFYTSLPLNFLH